MNSFIPYLWILELSVWITSEKVTLLDTSKTGWRQWMKNTDKFEGWRVQNLPPNGDEVYGVCDVHQPSSNSWLRSPFINRENGVSLHIVIYFTMRECKSYPDPKSLKHCEETFTLLTYESDSETDDVQYNERYFKPIGTISSNRKWENKDKTENILNKYETTISVKRKGVIIAFQNTGSCVMIKEVVVSYLRCSHVVNNFVYFPQTASPLGQSDITVIGRCVEGSVRMSESTRELINYCESGGSWKLFHFPGECHCSSGMEGNSNNSMCLKCKVSYYKPAVGMSKCILCPENSYSPMGSSRCYCNTGFYQISGEKENLLCKKPPAKPRNLIYDASDQARILLSWSRSTEEAYSSNNSLYYSVECVNCPNQLSFQPSSVVYDNKVTVLGALPSREYNFKVTTENEVTKYITNPFDIDQSAGKISVLTSPLETFEDIQIESVRSMKSSVFVTWKKPSSQEIIEYQCILLGSVDHAITANTKDSDYSVHIFTSDTFCTFANISYKIIDALVKVRGRNSKGWGQFSETKLKIMHEKKFNATIVKVITTQRSTTSEQSFDASSKFPNIFTDAEYPRKDVLLTIVGSIILMIVLITVIGLVVYCIRRQMMFTVYKQKFKNKKYETTNPNQIIYSSAYSLPSNTYKFHDPSTYEDISLALQDFTKEINPKWITTSSSIGEGEFGNVFKGELKLPNESEKIVAVKILKASATFKEKNDFLIEASTMGQFFHENVLKLEGVVSSSEPNMIITEYMVNGALLSYLIARKNELAILQLLKMLSNVANGMRYLSSMGFTHRDLAARNILLDENLICKVADFGLTRELSGKDLEEIYSNTDNKKIPIKWTAPEAILLGKFSPASDVWSFGVLAWEVLSYGDKPYWQWTNQEVLDALQSGYRLPPPVNCLPVIHSLMLHCWNCKPEQRPTFNQLYYEIDKITYQITLEIRNNDLEQRKEIKNCETAQLLLHCTDPHFDPVYNMTAPQPPPRNYTFRPINVSHNISSSDINSFSSIFPRKTLGLQGSLEWNNSFKKMSLTPQDSHTINLTKLRCNPVAPLHSYISQQSFCSQNITPLHPEYQSYSSEILAEKPPMIPPHKSKAIAMTIEQFLNSIGLAKHIPLLSSNGITSTDELRLFTSEQLKTLGLSSKSDRKKIFRFLESPIYC